MREFSVDVASWVIIEEQKYPLKGFLFKLVKLPFVVRCRGF